MSTLSFNKRANFDYEISEKFEAGLVLFGHEVKSIKNNRISLSGAFVTIKQSGATGPEVYITNCHIPKYTKANNLKNLSPDRPKKLLLKKKEINYLIGKKKEKGLTLVPLRIYTNSNLLKLEFGIGRGKKKYDKREAVKKRELDRKVRTLLKAN